jgi:hypothetical protein
MKDTSVLSLAVAPYLVSTQTQANNTTPKTDPCNDLAAQGQNQDSILKLDTVRDCYRAQKFNRDIAEDAQSGLDGRTREGSRDQVDMTSTWRCHT